uniref:Uncharacterized protein n=1 Tax=viral metagenome TaxID=1070528 RepID=A0A6C0K2U6_9ZZZZ
MQSFRFVIIFFSFITKKKLMSRREIGILLFQFMQENYGDDIMIYLTSLFSS